MNRFPVPLSLVLGIVFCLAHLAGVARLLDVYVEQDGHVIAHTYYDDGGRADAATVWRYLKNQPIMVDDDVTAVTARADNPLMVELESNLLIRIQHVDHIIAQVR